MVELAAKVPRPRRMLIPTGGVLAPAAAAPTLFQTPGHDVHRSSVSLRCGAQIPAQGLEAVGRDAAAVEQQIAEVVLAPVSAALGRGAIARRGALEVDRHAPAVLVAAAHHVHRLGWFSRAATQGDTECRPFIPRQLAAL